MSKIWNRLSQTRDSFKGGLPVWINPPKRKIIGALVMNPLQDMEKISAATPLAFDYALNQAKFLKSWLVISQTDDKVVVKASVATPEIYVGVNVMKCPSTITGTGDAAVVTAITVNDDYTAEITVAKATIGALTEGDFLVEAAEAGTGKAMYAVPTNGVYELSIDDTVGGDVTFVGVAQGNKYLYENTIADMPAIVKAAIQNVEWGKFNQLT